MKIDMDLLKKLRAATHAPLKDCKDALTESEGDLDKAQDILKEKGILKAAKKADRDTNEGRVKFAKEGNKTYGIKLGCETDFVAKNDMFINLIDQILDIVKTYDKNVANIDEVESEWLEKNINGVLQEAVGSIGENIKLIDMYVGEGNSYIYTHPGDKVVATVFFNGDNEEVAKEIALQTAAMDPLYMSVEDISEEEKEKMRSEFKEEMKDSGKPEDILDKIVEGKLNKSFSETVLLEQPYIRDDSKKVKDLLSDGFELLKIVRFSI